jgi:hypothetical protein
VKTCLVQPEPWQYLEDISCITDFYWYLAGIVAAVEESMKFYNMDAAAMPLSLVGHIMVYEYVRSRKQSLPAETSGSQFVREEYCTWN